MKLTPYVTWLLPCFVALPSLTSPAIVAAEENYTVCDLADTLFASETIADQFHEFGSAPGYPNEFSILSLPFSQVFELYVTDTVSERWNQSEWLDIIETIMSPDTTDMSDDIFGIVWSYFVRDDADENPSNAFVEFKIDLLTYPVIRIRMYDFADVPGLGGNASQFRNVITVNATESGQHAISMENMLGQGVAHELTHVCWAANGQDIEYGGYYSLNETMATLTEHFMGTSRPLIYDVSYDASFMREELCDVRSKYTVERMWMSYLYETFVGNVGDATDDLVYRWIRSDAEVEDRMKLSELAEILWDEDFDWIGGVDAADRLHLMFANFLAAKFANAPIFRPHGEFGIGSLNTVTDFGLFLDNCLTACSNPMEPVDCPGPDGYPFGHGGCCNVRMLIPEYELSEANEDVLTNASGIYEDGDALGVAGDGSKDYIDVYQWGTDYILFRAGEYYIDDGKHEFEIRITGTAKNGGQPDSYVRARPAGWVMGYSDDETPQLHPENLVFVEPLIFSPASTAGETIDARPVIVSDFGRTIRCVVVAIGATATTLENGFPFGGFVYEYDFGVFTPGASTRTWEGDVFVTGDVTVPESGTLAIDAGTHVKVFNEDLTPSGGDNERIEINVEGELIVNGTATDQVVFESWNPTTTEDWVGFYFDDESDGGTFNHCLISRAEYAIDSYVDLTVRNTAFKDCRYAGIVGQDGTVFVKDCTFSDPGTWGMFLVAADATVRNSVIDNATVTALNVQANATLVARNSQLLNSDKGLYVGGNTAVSLDSTCTISSNVIGVHCYNTGSTPVFKSSIINSNTGNGILCDNYSHPLIQSNTLRYNALAIYCTNSSNPTVKSNMIKSNTYGVSAASDSDPDFGVYPSSGNNTIAYSYYKHVVNWNEFEISAENNCWNVTTGECYPPSNKIYGPVDTDYPECCSTTSGASEGGGPMPKPEEPLPSTTDLVAVVPNPFNPSTTVHYTVASRQTVAIAVYDVRGRLVRELVNRAESAGEHSVHWNGVDARGMSVASGIYFVKLSAGSRTRTMKMVLLK